jgi:DNA replicative helicase MCM subunit Mcm2 (Cdc46/Mcm family)
MASENRIVYDLQDIGVRFACQKCGSATFVPVKDWKTLPPACSQCDQQWFAEVERHRDAEMLRGAFERVLKANTDVVAKTGVVKIQFEVNAPT